MTAQTTHHSPLTTLPLYHSTTHHSPVTTHHSPLTNLPLYHSTTHHSPLTNPFTFISQDSELNASVSRYFKYAHNMTHQSTNYQSPIIVQNEVIINEQLYGIYPFWFAFGKKNNIRVYGFTYKTTDWQNNLLGWQDFLGLQWLNSYRDCIDPERVPYFDSTKSTLYSILRPHGDDSLYDLAAKLRSSFVGVSKKLVTKPITSQILGKLKDSFIDPGYFVLEKFKKKEKKFHHFLDHLPERRSFWDAFQAIDNILTNLREISFFDEIDKSRILHLFGQLEIHTMNFYSFFEYLESYLRGNQNEH